MITVYRRSILLISVIALFVSAGCGLSQKPPSLHDFGVPVARLAMKSVSRPVVTVDAPKWLWDTGIHYRLLYASPTTVSSYLLDRWIAPPPELLEQQLVSGANRLNYPLIVRLLDFEQQFDAPERARVVLRFSVEVYSSDHKRHIGTRMFRLEQPTKTPDATGAVNAFAEAVRLALEQVDSWLMGVFDH